MAISVKSCNFFCSSRRIDILIFIIHLKDLNFPKERPQSAQRRCRKLCRLKGVARSLNNDWLHRFAYSPELTIITSLQFVLLSAEVTVFFLENKCGRADYGYGSRQSRQGHITVTTLVTLPTVTPVGPLSSGGKLGCKS